MTTSAYGFTGTYRPGDRVGIFGRGEFIVTTVLVDHLDMKPYTWWRALYWRLALHIEQARKLMAGP